MASRLRSFHVNRRRLCAIAALAVTAVVVLAGIAYYLDVRRYPSEHTPLVLQLWGISLIREEPTAPYDHPQPAFVNISLAWCEEESGGYYSALSLSSTKRFNISDFSLPDDLSTYSSLDITGWMSDDVIDGVRVIGPTGIFITDYDGDGLFDYGDAISLVTCTYEDGVLTHQGYYPNVVYMFALGSHDVGHDDPWQFKYAKHHGNLYSWEYNWFNN